MCSSCDKANKAREVRPNFPTPHIIFRDRKKGEEVSTFTPGVSLELWLDKYCEKTGETYKIKREGTHTRLSVRSYCG